MKKMCIRDRICSLSISEPVLNSNIESIMKLTKYITTACIAALFTGCDYLDFDETTGMTKEEMYSYFGNVTSLSTFVYSQLPQDFGAIGDALRDAATDNAVYTWNQSSVDVYKRQL